MTAAGNWKRGFTLLELLIVIMLVAALATLFFPLFGYLREKARDAACIGNLRILQLGAATYMLDHDAIWPQMPETLATGDSEEAMWKWWYEDLKDYGVSKRHWICPSEAASDGEKYSTTDEFYGSYIPTGFEATPNIAFYWTGQPWFIERGQMHGNNHGANVAMPDGTVRASPSLFEQH
jgi:prepilin-type N-terminal cleavage/methylation domain-containing protein